MKRRDFALGLMASPLVMNSGPVWSGEQPPLAAFGRIRLKLENTTVQPKSLEFTYNSKAASRFNLVRAYPQINEDRAYIPGVNLPNLSYTFKGSRLVGNVGYRNKTIFVTPKIDLYGEYAGIHLANKDRSFLLGTDLEMNVNRASEDKIPDLGNIPKIGSLFRSDKKTDGKRHLLIYIAPSVVKF